MLLEGMVVRGTTCLRRAGGGERSCEVRFGRFLSNDKVTVERLIAGWGVATAAAAAGRHVLAIQDTTEVNLSCTALRDRGSGEIGKGVGRGLLVHAMLALDAGSLCCLGLAGGVIWTRRGRQAVPHRKRRPEERESHRWTTTAAQGQAVLARAAMVTTIGDQESDIYGYWAGPRAENVHRLGRAYCNRSLAEGGSLHTVSAAWPIAGTRQLALKERPGRAARRASLRLRFGPLTLLRPKGEKRSLPETVALTLVEVVEENPPPDAEPVHWRLLTTHAIPDAAAAWQVVDWYTARWTIEQLWRLLKTQGLRLEDSQIDTAGKLLKLAAVATRAATVVLQLNQARGAAAAEPAALAFQEGELAALDALDARYGARTARQSNPHPKRSLPWAAWIIARLGGWDGYASSRPPGPITLKRGLDTFYAIATGWTLRDLCMP